LNIKKTPIETGASARPTGPSGREAELATREGCLLVLVPARLEGLPSQGDSDAAEAGDHGHHGEAEPERDAGLLHADRVQHGERGEVERHGRDDGLPEVEEAVREVVRVLDHGGRAVARERRRCDREEGECHIRGKGTFHGNSPAGLMKHEGPVPSHIIVPYEKPRNVSLRGFSYGV